MKIKVSKFVFLGENSDALGEKIITETSGSIFFHIITMLFFTPPRKRNLPLEKLIPPKITL